MKMISPLRRTFKLGAPARIFGSAVSENLDVRKEQTRLIEHYWDSRRFERGVEFQTVPVVVDDFSVVHSYRYVGDKFLFNGSSSVRFFNRFLWHRRKSKGWSGHRAFQSRLVEILEQSSVGEDAFRSDYYDADDLSNLPFVIDCKNYKNFYHFLTEAFCHLSLVDEWALKGPIIFASAMKPSERRKFFDRMVADFFPHLKDRVSFKKSRIHFAKAITYYTFREGVVGSAEKARLAELFPGDVAKVNGVSSRSAGSILRQNAYDVSQKRLRNAALKEALSHSLGAQLPKRIWVSRRADPSVRDRSMVNEDYLFDELKKLGFEKIFFEDIRPIEQAKLMQNAEIVAAYHGAGLANMLFAGADTTVIEYGNLHTATYRWEEFMQHAYVSGCRYVSFFADMKGVENDEDPIAFVGSFKSMGNVPVRLETQTADQTLEYIRFLCVLSGDTSVTFDPVVVADLILGMRDWTLFQKLLETPECDMVEPWMKLSWHAVKCRTLKHYAEAVMYLEKARELNPRRPMLLERAINIANKAGLSDKLETLLHHYRDEFPSRYRKYCEQNSTKN